VLAFFEFYIEGKIGCFVGSSTWYSI